MNLAPLAQILTAHAQTADNNTALALSDTHETVLDPKTHLPGGIALTRPFQPNQPPADGLGPHDTILEKFTTKLSCVFKLRDTKRNCYLLGLNIVLLC